MKLSPVIVFNYNRPEHSQQVWDALAQNQYAAETELYLCCDGPKADELKEMTDTYGALLSVQSHGWEHTDAAKMTAEELKANITKTIEALAPYTSHSIPVKYHAYTWGSYTKENDEVLHSMGLIPVKINGRVNYNDSSCIERG